MQGRSLTSEINGQSWSNPFLSCSWHSLCNNLIEFFRGACKGPGKWSCRARGNMIRASQLKLWSCFHVNSKNCSPRLAKPARRRSTGHRRCNLQPRHNHSLIILISDGYEPNLQMIPESSLTFQGFLIREILKNIQVVRSRFLLLLFSTMWPT